VGGLSCITAFESRVRGGGLQIQAPSAGLQNSSLPAIIKRPKIETDGPDTGDGDHWIVTVFNNDYNTVDQVIAVLMLATKCSRREAEMETWEIHHLGKSVVHHGEEEECRKAGDTIAKIGIRVEVSTE
jgi:ATP-dependent Clp protease adapter protein ClpS